MGGRVLRVRFAAAPVKQPIPRRERDHRDPAEESQQASQRAAMAQQKRPAQQSVPVVKAGAQKRQRHFLGVGDVAGDVQEILSKPYPGNSETGRLACAPKRETESGRHDALQQRASHKIQRVSERPENNVPRLVHKQVERVQNA